MQLEDSQPIPPTHRWPAPQLWPVAPRYMIVDPAADREAINHQMGKSGARLNLPPLSDIYRQGVLMPDTDWAAWERGEQTTIEEDRVYDPLTLKELPAELAALHEGDQGRVLQFAHRRGLLGYGFLKGPRREPTEAEPLSWIWAHAETARRVLKLITLLRDQDEQLGVYLASIAEPAPLAGTVFETQQWQRFGSHYPSDRVTNVFFRYAQGRDPNQYAHWDIDGVGLSITALESQKQCELAWYVVCRSINSNVETVFPQLGKTDYVGPLHQFEYPALITALYLHLYDIAAGRTQVGECRWCGKFFILSGDKRGPKPRYCPRPDSTIGDSYCSQRSRTRRWRNSPKGGSDD